MISVNGDGVGVKGLRIADLRITFGGLVAVNGLTMGVRKGSIVGLIGPNGAGKSTVLNAISRFVSGSATELSLDGVDLRSIAPHELLNLGCARTFQTPQLVSEMDVFGNALLGHHPRLAQGFAAALVASPAARRSEREGRARAAESIEFCNLARWAHHRVDETPYGVRKMTEIARALVCKPGLLLLDEPVAGISVEEKREIARLLQRIRDRVGCGLLVVDHDMTFIRELCDHAYVMDFGELIAEGSPQEVLRDARVIEAYLGPSECAS